MVSFESGRAALKAIGTAMTLVTGGMYLDQRGFVNAGTEMLTEQFDSSLVFLPSHVLTCSRRCEQNPKRHFQDMSNNWDFPFTSSRKLSNARL